MGKATGVSQSVGTPRIQANTTGKVYGAAQASKLSFHMASNSVTTLSQPSLKKPTTTGRGFPPPIPPNKPVVPPKKDVVRRTENDKAAEQMAVDVKYSVNIRDKVHCPEVHEEEPSRREPQVSI